MRRRRINDKDFFKATSLPSFSFSLFHIPSISSNFCHSPVHPPSHPHSPTHHTHTVDIQYIHTYNYTHRPHTRSLDKCHLNMFLRCCSDMGVHTRGDQTNTHDKYKGSHKNIHPLNCCKSIMAYRTPIHLNG